MMLVVCPSDRIALVRLGGIPPERRVTSCDDILSCLTYACSRNCTCSHLDRIVSRRIPCTLR
eukprot:NODE_11736_length_218_cov_22.124260_g10995_i0.p1 GENE.NODE_11736_length_218_cov_22.124260_g10995_i0~~NODE_11736_length_218_cov_22.124260_g10995_i0.p1  ORF type:complete len:69 (+),score=0.99 NODE_11736_length_218_cov_22.124260_g10995_i0:22-207(+)